MTKADLIEEVSRLAELTRKDSEVIVETIFDSVVRALRVGDKIEIRGFGSFRTRERRPRVGRNPKTGDRVEVPAKRGGWLVTMVNAILSCDLNRLGWTSVRKGLESLDCQRGLELEPRFEVVGPHHLGGVMSHIGTRQPNHRSDTDAGISARAEYQRDGRRG